MTGAFSIYYLQKFIHRRCTGSLFVRGWSSSSRA